MKSLYKLLAVITIFSIIFVTLKSRSNTCELQVTSGEAISVQLRERIYHRIINPPICPPDKIVLAIPDNLKTTTGEPISAKGNQEAPKISTLITISNKSNRFFIGRIDKIGDQWFYTKYDTCLAWKWSVEDNDKQVLYLSTERNLQIYSNNISRIIFVISLPFEIIETQPEILVQPYTWNRIGGFYRLSMTSYPELARDLRLVEEDRPQASNTFYPGQAVSPDLVKELDRIDKMGGVHYNRELETNLVQLDAKAFQPSLTAGSCAVPDYLIDPTAPNYCIIPPRK